MVELENRPEADNLVTIYAALAGESRAETLARFSGQNFSAFKAALVEVAVGHLAPINAEMNRLLADPAEIDRIMKRGAERAGEIAIATMREIHDIIGLLRP